MRNPVDPQSARGSDEIHATHPGRVVMVTRSKRLPGPARSRRHPRFAFVSRAWYAWRHAAVSLFGEFRRPAVGMAL